MAVGEHLETYLRWVFGFIGVTNLEFISADGIQLGPEHREKAMAGALAGRDQSPRGLTYSRDRHRPPSERGGGLVSRHQIERNGLVPRALHTHQHRDQRNQAGQCRKTA